MILDRLENADSYFNVARGLAEAFQFLRRPELKSTAPGRYPIDGEKIFAMVQEYPTKKPEETFWETHRKYIDVQYMQTGVEAMGWSPIQSMKMKKDYDPEKDIFVWDGTGQTIHVPAGSFVIFKPHDSHMGGLLIGQPQPVRKIVIKVGV